MLPTGLSAFVKHWCSALESVVEVNATMAGKPATRKFALVRSRRVLKLTNSRLCRLMAFSWVTRR
jgi:hypothetical protein